jgi:hypothetical protein
MLLTVGNTFHKEIETYVSPDLKAAVAILGGWNENKTVICAQFILFTIYYEKIKDVLLSYSMEQSPS